MSAEATGKRRLGRGLEALLGVGSVQEAARDGDLREIPLAEVAPNPFQPRRAFDPAALEDLKRSLAATGLLQPVVVRETDGGYQLVAGERRWRAAKALGWKRIPAVVRDVDDRTLLTLALVENLQRASLSPIDEAEGYERLANQFGLSHGDIAERVGRDRSTVANAIRLLKLPKAVQALLDAGALSAGHARALLSLPAERDIVRLAREAVAKDWSVRELEQQARSPQKPAAAGAGKGRGARRAAPPEARRIEDALRKKLGTDAKVVVTGKGKGHVSLRFYSSDDLARLLELILGAALGRLVRGPGYRVMVHRDGSLKSREVHVPLWLLRAAAIVGTAVLVAVVAIAVAYGPIVAAAAREPLLASQVARLTRENRRVAELATALDDAEARYAQLRGMLGAQIGAPPEEGHAAGPREEERLYVAPPLVARAPADHGDSATTTEEGPSVPHLWPLAVQSYRTRGMVGVNSRQESHPGVDLAVPVGSDVRATGGGLVREAGQDSAYGLFVLIQHPDGYQSMYGHLSRLLVARNDAVRAGQVIALSGNTGRSTAPHLHFEIRRGGQSIDPLTLVREGR